MCSVTLYNRRAQQLLPLEDHIWFIVPLSGKLTIPLLSSTFEHFVFSAQMHHYLEVQCKSEFKNK